VNLSQLSTSINIPVDIKYKTYTEEFTVKMELLDLAMLNFMGEAQKVHLIKNFSGVHVSQHKAPTNNQNIGIINNGMYIKSFKLSLELFGRMMRPNFMT
jgi:hypothetical protein